MDTVVSPARAAGPLVTRWGRGVGGSRPRGPRMGGKRWSLLSEGQPVPPLQSCAVPSLCPPSPESGGRAGRSQPRSRQASCRPGCLGDARARRSLSGAGDGPAPSLPPLRPLGGWPSPVLRTGRGCCHHLADPALGAGRPALAGPGPPSRDLDRGPCARAGWAAGAPDLGLVPRTRRPRSQACPLALRSHPWGHPLGLSG